MIQSVAQKTSISEKTWRRQTNSPSWWIAFSCGSVILHVLAFWLISLYTQNSSLKGRSQSAVAIEFIEISPQKSSPVKPLPKSQPKPKPVSPKPKPISQNSQPTNLSTPISTNDRDAIAFNNQKIQEQLEKQQKQLELAQRQRQQEAQQRQLEALQRQQEAEQQRQLAEQLRQRVAQQEQLEAQLRQRERLQQRQLEAQLRQQEQLQQELEQRLRQREAQQQLQQERLRQQERLQRQFEQAQRQREQKEKQRLLAEKLRQQEQQEKQRLLAQKLRQREQKEKQRLLAQKLRQRQLNQQQNQNPGDGEQITDAIQNKLGQTPQQRQVPSQTPIKETQLNQNGGILTANWDVADKAITRDIPTNPPKPKQNISQSFVIPATDANNLESANFQVYLMINESGTVEFTRVDENIPVEKRQLYQKYVDKQLLNKKLFNPATDADPTTGELKPRRGELYIRIKIQRGY